MLSAQVRRVEEAVGLVQEEQAAAADRARDAAGVARRLQVPAVTRIDSDILYKRYIYIYIYIYDAAIPSLADSRCPP
jgi:hypothetical protein